MLAILPLALAVSTAWAQSAEYEYVVIGSGPGGGSLAANLARAGHSVFLIEAGEDHGDSRLQQMPAMADRSSEDPTMAWNFFVSHYEDPEQAYRDSKYTWRTTNDTLYVGRDPPEGSEPLGILYPRTGTLGGCGNHNAMNFALPPDNDWNHIANVTGDSSWNAENMRQLYERIEHNDYITNGTSREGHGFDGWLHSNHNDIELIRDSPGLLEHIQMLFNQVGTYPNSTDEIFRLLQRDMNRIDSNRYEEEGLYQIPLHYDALRRRSSSQTYLRDTVNELNEDGSPRYPLTISTTSLATKVIFDTTSDRPRAIGVEYLRGQALYRADPRHNGLQVGTPMNVTASREVIVSGGAFNTPQILKLSGIGPREELESFGIPVIQDLPAVGENLQDNNEGGIVVEAAQSFNNPFETWNCTLLAPGDPCLRAWQESGSGPYGIGAAPVGMLRRSSVSENADADLFYFGAAGTVFEGHYPGYSQAQYSSNSLFWSAVKMQSQNYAGHVRLRSADPQDTPIINFSFFAEGREHDLQALAEGVQFVLDVVNQTGPPFGPFTVVHPDPSLPVEQAIMDETFSHHATSTCVMGRANDTQNSCVDNRFRVHGVDGLRVVDGSIFPRVPGAFPVLPTFMVSEKATDAILEDAAAGNGTAAYRKRM